MRLSCLLFFNIFFSSLFFSFAVSFFSATFLQHQYKKHHRFIVTVILLLCTSKQGGKPCQKISRSLKYEALAVSFCAVPSDGDGSVVKITAVSSLCLTISSFRIRCCARLGKSLNEKGTDACCGYPDAAAARAAKTDEGPEDERRV